MNKNHSKKNGRFISNTDAVKASAVFPKKGGDAKIHEVMGEGLPVYGKKNLSGNPSKLKAGSKVVITVTDAVA